MYLWIEGMIKCLCLINVRFLSKRRIVMGSRGSFVDINSEDLSFVENGQTYHIIWDYQNVKVIIRDKGQSVKAPDFSHTANAVYAIVQNGKLKHIAWYGENHHQIVCIDFLHSHNGVIPHKHYLLDHTDVGISISTRDENLARGIRRRLNLKWELVNINH